MVVSIEQKTTIENRGETYTYNDISNSVNPDCGIVACIKLGTSDLIRRDRHEGDYPPLKEAILFCGL